MSDDDKIRCTFEDCYLRFDTVEAMKKHKARATDQIHEFYCKKCDEDCEDDIAYLIHQIQSRKHSMSYLFPININANTYGQSRARSVEPSSKVKVVETDMSAL